MTRVVGAGLSCQHLPPRGFNGDRPQSLEDVLDCGKQPNIVATCEKTVVSYAQITLRISLLEIPLEPDDKPLFFYLGVVSRLR